VHRFIGVFFSIFLVVGVLLLGVAGVVAVRTVQFLGGANSATGEVVELVPHRSSKGGTTWSPVVSYTVNGEVHRLEGSYSSNVLMYEVGERVTVRYEPGNPGEARIDGWLGTWLLPTILGGIGVVFGAVGGGFLLVRLRRRRRRDWLLANGARIQARLIGVEQNTSFSVNGRSPWRLRCQWQDPSTGRVHVFVSDDVWYDPGPFVKKDELDVLIDASNPARHHVDISFLPEQAS
jgi:hypothetical protein